MKNKILVVFNLIIILLTTTITYATDINKDFYAEKNINIMGNNEYKYIWLDEEVYKYSNQDLSDLRIVSDGKTIPYFIQNEYSEYATRQEQYTSRLIDVKRANNKDSIDFEIQKKAKNIDVNINGIVLNVEGNNYVKEINILGSYEGETWENISKDKIYNLNYINKNSIVFNRNCKYNFYRIEIPMNDENLKLISLTGYRDENSMNISTYGKQKNAVYTIENKDKNTYIKIDNQNRLPISQIKVGTNSIFKRDYTVFTLDKENSIINGEIYNLNFKNMKAENTTMELPREIRDTIITIIISNEDDAPIKVDNVDITYNADKLIFNAEAGKEYKLSYNNPNAEKPVYDIEKYKAYITSEQIDESTLSSAIVREIPQVVKKDNKNEELYKVIFNIIMVAASIGLIGYIAVKLKKNG